MKVKLRHLVLALLALLVLAVGAGTAATWAPDVPVEQLKARWAQAPSQFVEVAGLQVHVRDEGPRDDPEPIVLLHGTSASLHTWEGWARELRTNRRVVRFDLPGFALTGPNAQNDYSVDRYVAFVAAMLNQLQLRRVVLAGNSLGGQIAWSFAGTHPERVARLVLVDASGYPPESLKNRPSVPIGFRIANTPGLRWLMQNTLPRGVVDSSVRNVYGDPAKVTPELVDLYVAMTLREGNRKALGRRFEQGYTGRTELLAKIKCPTLILWGGRDRLVPLESGERFARDIADARLVVLDTLGHVPHEEDPAATLREVRPFLSSPGPAPRP
ncbi:alpha/beta fold hydrolase [Ramlibacter solisilvae]|uniref:Alpha/beta hydrolase n=1 Tax=Ramlibacter tataouinensis TaxID=94132 RepID=A0A127JVW5_9BURK|nr:alpha/beta hydrolase [Ramlibacter tataouinensis]AMO24023.1 alpha/beta hydrolase [Ramlibacter tataouinensis]